MGQLEYRKYQPGDEEKLVVLYRATFNDETYSLADWAWRILGNPEGNTYVWLAFDGAKCVGQYALFPNSLYVDGAEMMSLQLVTSMVHPDYQRRGIFTSLVKLSDADIPAGMPMHGFPNEKSFPIYTHRLGWAYHGDIDVYVKSVSLRMPRRGKRVLLAALPFLRLWQARPLRRLEPVELVAFSNFDEIGDIWRRNRDRLGITLNRTREWLRWKYDVNPAEYGRYRVIDNGRAAGFVIVRREERFGLSFCWIVDILVDESEDETLFARTLLSLERNVRAEGGFLSLLLPKEGFRKAVRRAGFFRIPPRFLPHRFFFVKKVNGYAGRAFAEKDSWYMTWGTHDIL